MANLRGLLASFSKINSEETIEEHGIQGLNNNNDKHYKNKNKTLTRESLEGDCGYECVLGWSGVWLGHQGEDRIKCDFGTIIVNPLTGNQPRQQMQVLAGYLLGSELCWERA